MFMLGAFSLCQTMSRKPAENLQDRLSSWIGKIRNRAKASIDFANGWACAGSGEDFNKAGADWYLSSTTRHNAIEIYMQAHGFPKTLSDLSRLAAQFADFDQNVDSIKEALRSLNTEYLCVVYDASRHLLYVISDKLGIVPVYTCIRDGVFYYATALWVLKLIPEFNDELDWQGVAEKLYFRAQLGDRTMYKDVKRSTGGTILRVSEATKICSYYKLWERCHAFAPQQAVTSLVQGFNAAVADRLSDNNVQYSTLSGGLDSRVVVTSLSRHTDRIITFNVAASGTLDCALSEQYARHIGTEHYHEQIFALRYPNFSLLARDFIDRLHLKRRGTPQAIWTGDDGSLSIGFVYLRRAFLLELNALDDEHVPAYICKASRVLPPRMFNRRSYGELRILAQKGVREFLEEMGEVEHDAKYYCFLMLNRVARMFDEHYETAHLHRIFRCMPFLDVRTIEPVLSTDMPEACEHRLYLDFARRADPRNLEIPWQAYPGHEPCPLPLPNARNQWQSYAKAEAQFLREVDRRNMLTVLTSQMWRKVVRREMLAAYVIRDWLGIEPTNGLANALYDMLKEHAYQGLTAY